MGHTRLGKIPKSKKWSAVVATVAAVNTEDEVGVDGISQHVKVVAQKTLEAASGGLDIAITDTGLKYTFYLLTQVVLASRNIDWQQDLKRLGIQVSPSSSFQDLAAEIQAAIDDFVFSQGRSSDIGEIAQRAAGETLAELVANRAVTLFSSDLEDLRLAIRPLSTKQGFSRLGQKFFGTFMARFLNFYLSRVTATELGGNGFRQVGDVSSFNEALRLHCEQSARIVFDFSGEWYSKTEFVEGIDPTNSAGFVAVAMKKLKAELGQQGAEE